MRLRQELWKANCGWKTVLEKGKVTTADFVLCFANNDILSQSRLHTDISEKYPLSNIVYCSAAGEIAGDQVFMKHNGNNGELAPVIAGGHCQLHNQRLSITTLKEF